MIVGDQFGFPEEIGLFVFFSNGVENLKGFCGPVRCGNYVYLEWKIS